MSKTVFDELSEQQHRGVLLVLTGPTGAGKDSVLNKILELNTHARKIITSTTRAPRDNETEGNPYHFLTKEEFEHKIGLGEFFEWVEFRGELYGTSKKALEDALQAGYDAIWRIDTKGVKNIKAKVQKITDRSVFVFLTASNMQELEERVRLAEGEDFATRWKPDLVAWELHQYDDCDYLVENQTNRLDETVKNVISILESKRQEIVKQAS